MHRLIVRTCSLMISLLAIAGIASAQTTIITPTNAFAWFPSPSETVLFNGAPLVTNYQMNLFLKTAVTGTAEPTTPPALTVNLGKPTVDATGSEVSGPIRSMIVAGAEYIAFLHAVGPGGLSTPVGPIGPFGFPPPPSPAGAVVIK